jgi:DNA-binding MarR family transcriptional regulator/DNA-binding transcriptional MerR regulator
VLLTAGERVLLHLLAFWNVKDPPEAITQQGIAEATRIRRSHIPRTVKALMKDAYVDEREGHVRGRGRKVKLYFLTESGLRRARELAGALDAQPIVADGGPTTFGQFARASERTLLDIALDVDGEGRYQGAAREKGLPTFLGRRDELAALADWLRGDCAVMVVYGGVGIGKTALARRFLQRSQRVFWWRNLQGEDDSNALLDELAAHLKDQGGRGISPTASREEKLEGLAADLRGRDALLVFDDYGEVSEDLVEMFRDVARVAHEAGAKVLVLAQDSTPSYCRFYTRRDVEGNRVQEIKIRGLTLEESRELLGSPNIAEEALRRIYLLTKGAPLYLQLIREGDAETLKARSRFTSAEVNLLLFSRDVVS